MYSSDTIIAQCTPCGSGAIALIRISGRDALGIATKITDLASKKAVADVETHTINYGWIINHEGNTVDEVLISVMHGPRTFTGEHVVEINCHNNQLLIEEIIEAAIRFGARIARRGEFTQRAFFNGKIDLLQAEAINELIHAQTQHALKQSLAQLDGSFSQWISQLEQDVSKMLAWCEASFEFPDEQGDFSGTLRDQRAQLLGRIRETKRLFDLQKHVRQGIRVAILGIVNAGKSSLFNAILGTKRALVSEQAGTTRDTIEASLCYCGNNVTFIDTAGIRETCDVLEKEGIERAHKEAITADIIMLVVDGSRELVREEESFYQELFSAHKKKVILVYSKMDLVSSRSEKRPRTRLEFSDGSVEVVHVSAYDPTTLERLEHALGKKLKELFDVADSPFLLNQRHYHVLLELEAQLEKIGTMPDVLGGTMCYELIAHHLRVALAQLGELTGKALNERVLDMIFKEFCIGK